jgi:AbrB family looped-hinge helix DNA binding protein
MKTIVSEKGQITIPKRLRDRLGLRPGTVIDFEESDGRLVGRRLAPVDHLEDLVGIIEVPGGTDRFIESLRGAAPTGTPIATPPDAEA